ncbi:ABC transporter ATP-binding protein [Guptibacillus algicola]|uniref:ABC transporter ATP-binding protein n=1 Tax=Guptibacillus algicola TaxID=225844 RepID=UPI001CD4D0E2|nr:ABC transporter ATP-binding protein [Alkalihalobacillus algicola]MCA0989061.1 ABC transporter ATP-binding protein [Alkalihalobacillus algicola]
MIEIVNLTKRYGTFTALDQMNVTIEKGTVFGVVGPNGAGKSTTFSILATLLAPTSGTAYIDGIDVTQNPSKIREYIGYMPDFFGVYDSLKAGEYLDFYGASYGIHPKEREALIPQLLELVNLAHKKDTYVDSLSRGMKQRLCLARCLIHDPEVLILDEPASGLDPRARVEMRDILKELKAMGKTILISSHILPELSEMCDSLGVIENGQLVATGSVSAIQQQLKANKVLIVTVQHELDRAIQFFEDQPLAVDIRKTTETEIQFGFNGSDDDQILLLKEALHHQLPILSFTEEKTDLEDIFMEITKGVE